MLDPKRLLTLVELGRAGSFAKAAAALDYTPGAVWQQIRALEAEVDATLVVSGRSGTRLTTAGQSLVDAALPALEALGAVGEHVDALHRRSSGWTTLIASTDAAAAVAAQALARLRRASGPTTRIEVTEETPPRCLDAVADGRRDVAVVCARPQLLRCDPPLEVALRCPEPRVLVFPHGHAAQDIPVLDHAALEHLAPLGWAADAAHEGLACPGASAVALISMVDHGLGVAVMPGLAVEVLPSHVGWRPIDAAPAREVLVATGPTADPDTQALVQALIDTVEDHVRRWQLRASEPVTE